MNQHESNCTREPECTHSTSLDYSSTEGSGRVEGQGTRIMAEVSRYHASQLFLSAQSISGVLLDYHTIISKTKNISYTAKCGTRMGDYKLPAAS